MCTCGLIAVAVAVAAAVAAAVNGCVASGMIRSVGYVLLECFYLELMELRML